jgi:hypothetical protein
MILHEMMADGDYVITQRTVSIADKPVVWRRAFFLLPKETIGGQSRIGFLYTRKVEGEFMTFSVPQPTFRVEYATKKELFVWRLKNGG